MSKMIKLNDILATRFEALRLRLGYIKQTDMLTDICKFFEVNAIDLKQENFKSSFTKLTETIEKRFNSLNARITMDFKNLNQFSDDLTNFNSIFNDITIKNKIENFTVSENNKDILSLDNSKNYEKAIQNLEKENLNYINSIEEYDKKLNEYHRCLRKLNESMKVEKSTFGKKAYIDLPINDIEDLFYLIS